MISFMLLYIHYRLPILTDYAALPGPACILSHIVLLEAQAKQAPLIQCFIGCNNHPLIPHTF